LNRQEKFNFFIRYFSTHQPDAKTELHYENPFELLVAVILSAQCTDKRVNLVTPPLLLRFPTPTKMAVATFDEVFPFIKSISYPNNKTKHLIGMAKGLVDKYNSQVPSEVEELMTLPGVGRKTANVIASVVYKQPKMAVDTHVFRVAERIGLSKNSKTPLETEKQLIKYIPEDKIHLAHHWLILHGRYVCTARKPKCDECGVREVCDYRRKDG